MKENPDPHRNEKIPRTLTNYNFLNAGGWNLSLSRFPHLRFFCTKVSIPSITWVNIDYDTMTGRFQVPGDKQETKEISFEYNVDEDLETWLSLMRLANAMTFPEQSYQYQEYFERGREEKTMYQDITVSITNNSKVSQYEVVFHDCLLKEVGGLNLEIPTDTPGVVTSTAVFNFSYYEVRKPGRTENIVSELPNKPMPNDWKDKTNIPEGYDTHGKLFGDNSTKVTW